MEAILRDMKNVSSMLIIFFITLASISGVSAAVFDEVINKIGESDFDKEFTLDDGQYVSLPFNELYTLDVGILHNYPKTIDCNNQICYHVGVYLRIGSQSSVTSMSYKHRPDWELGSVEASTFKLTLLDLDFEGSTKVNARFVAEKKDIAPLAVDMDKEFTLIQNQEATLKESNIRTKLLGLDENEILFLKITDNYGEGSISEYSYKTSLRYKRTAVMSCGEYYYEIDCFGDVCLYLNCLDYLKNVITEAKVDLIFGKKDEHLDECFADADCGISEDPCISYICGGTPKKCIEGIIVNCIDNDGCCPTGCMYPNDNDCEKVAVCTEGEVKYYTCLDGTNVSWCSCIAEEWRCIDSPESQCLSVCAGCSYKDDCLSIGTRIDSQYCSLIKALMVQKSEEEICNNNYECKSNECSDGKCISTYTLLQKIFELLKTIFGKGWLWGK